MKKKLKTQIWAKNSGLIDPNKSSMFGLACSKFGLKISESCSKFDVSMFEVFSVRYFGVRSKTSVYPLGCQRLVTLAIWNHMKWSALALKSSHMYHIKTLHHHHHCGLNQDVVLLCPSGHLPGCFLSSTFIVNTYTQTLI